MKTSASLMSGVVVGLAVLYLGTSMFWPAHSSQPYNLSEFAALPVADNGRIKPLDSVARTNLMILSGGRQTWRDARDRKQPASRWLLDVMALAVGDPSDDRQALKHRVFRIENDQVRGLLGLEARDGFRYSYEEILPRFEEFRTRYEHVRELPSAKRDLYDNKVMELANHLEIFHRLTPKFDAPQSGAPHLIPPPRPGEEWLTCFQAIKVSGGQPQELPLGLQEYVHLLKAYVKGEPETFNEILKQYGQALDKKFPQQMAAAHFEVFFNQFQPFQKCYILYGVVFLLSCLGWLLWRDLHWAAFWLAVLTLVVHTWALGARIYLSGRPPVTNLYSSAVFIGWVAVIVCLLLEAIFRRGIGNVVGGLIGVLTLIIAHYLSLDGDTMQVLMAVLDTNFWLTAHVLVIAMGYTAMFVTGFLGIVFALLGPITLALNLGGNRLNLLQAGIRQDVYRMTYGVACFGMVTSFVGTVLGGIWADYSWGRFWGWDPKENGALLIVIWCAIMLHARWGGMVKARGFAVLAILGNVVTAWSWFGTNQLGIGLHSYGFMGGAMTWLFIFAGSQLLLSGICLVPDGFWLRYLPETKPPTETAQKVKGPLATANQG